MSIAVWKLALDLGSDAISLHGPVESLGSHKAASTSEFLPSGCCSDLVLSTDMETHSLQAQNTFDYGSRTRRQSSQFEFPDPVTILH